MRGGSDLLSWKYDEPNVPHGYIREFHLPDARVAILQQLQQMYKNGQTKLGWAVCYYEGGDTLALDSTDGLLAGQDHQNLVDLITATKDIGFDEHLVEMVPEWSAAWNNWANPAVMQKLGTRYWQPREYGRNFEFTCQVKEVFLLSGVSHRVDLVAEMVPTPTDPNLGIILEYCQRMVEDWWSQFPGDGTVGFSIIPTVDRVSMLSKIYPDPSRMPDVWSIHPYANELGKTAQQTITDFINAMVAAGLGRYGFVVGETDTGSLQVKQALAAQYAMIIWYALQWPVGEDTQVGVSQDRLTTDWIY